MNRSMIALRSSQLEFPFLGRRLNINGNAIPLYVTPSMRTLMSKSPNFQSVRSMLSTSPVLTGSSENIILATRSRLRAYLAMNLWMRRRLESLSTVVGIAAASLWRLTVCTTHKAWSMKAMTFMRAKFVEFSKCSCIIGRILLTLTEPLGFGYLHTKSGNFSLKLLNFKDFFKIQQADN